MRRRTFLFASNLRPSRFLATSQNPSWEPRRLARQCGSLKMSSTDASTIGEAEVVAALKSVRTRIHNATPKGRANPVQLVAVSKTKPISLLQAAYEGGQRHFGENYVQELVQKAEEMPHDVKWHFIGPLQSNKAKALVGVPNLHVVESIDREKTVAALDKAITAVDRKHPLEVMVQVNTSGEDSKSGCAPGETIELVQAVLSSSSLRLVGLMTIGALDDSEEPQAFQILKEERDKIAQAIGYDPNTLKLSMGMSNDFEAAIRMGSDSVRLGSTIFGARNYSK